MSLPNGLYKVEFQTPLGAGAGAGVVVLMDGVIMGGDSLIYYAGDYIEIDKQFNATVKTNAHSKVPGMSSVFGKDRVTINISGTTDGSNAVLQGTSPDAPGVKFSAKLSMLNI